MKYTAPIEDDQELQRKAELLRTFPQYTTSVNGDFATLGIVTGIAVMGANALRDLAAGLTDLFGGRSGQYENVLKRGQDAALTEMCEDAVSRGADLVAGVKLDYETIGKMLIVCASGTALKRNTSAPADPASAEIA